MSLTSDVKGVATNFNGDPQSENVIVIDTPGIGDSRNNDAAHIHDIVVSLKLIGYVHTFLITINSQNPRFDEQL